MTGRQPAVLRSAAPIRLLLVTDTAILGRGGSERFICNLLGGLDPRLFRVDVLQLIEPPPQADRLREQPPGEHIRLEYRPVDAVYGRRGRAARVAGVPLRVRPDELVDPQSGGRRGDAAELGTPDRLSDRGGDLLLLPRGRRR